MADQERYYVRVFTRGAEENDLVAEVVNSRVSANDNAVESRYFGSQAIAAALVKAQELNKQSRLPEKKDDERLVQAQRGLAEAVKLIHWLEATILYRARETARRKGDDRTPCCLYCYTPKGQIHAPGCAWEERVATIKDAYGRSK